MGRYDDKISTSNKIEYINRKEVFCMETIHLQQVLPHEIEKRSFEIIEQELIERGELD